MTELSHTPTMTIGVAARLLSISSSLIRLYETEGLICLYREPSGRRLLSEDDVNRIRCIKQHLDEGLNFEGMRRILALIPCWKIKPCSLISRDQCPAFQQELRPCWASNGCLCRADPAICRTCPVYEQADRCTDNIKQFVK